MTGFQPSPRTIRLRRTSWKKGVESLITSNTLYGEKEVYSASPCQESIRSSHRASRQSTRPASGRRSMGQSAYRCDESLRRRHERRVDSLHRGAENARGNPEKFIRHATIQGRTGSVEPMQERGRERPEGLVRGWRAHGQEAESYAGRDYGRLRRRRT